MKAVIFISSIILSLGIAQASSLSSHFDDFGDTTYTINKTTVEDPFERMENNIFREPDFFEPSWAHSSWDDFTPYDSGDKLSSMMENGTCPDSVDSMDLVDSSHSESFTGNGYSSSTSCSYSSSSSWHN